MMLFPSTPSSCSTPSPSSVIPSDNEMEGTQNAAIVISNSSCSSSVDMQANLSDDEYYIPSSGLLLHILRWTVYAVEERSGKLQRRMDILEKVKDSIKSQYDGKVDACDD